MSDLSHLLERNRQWADRTRARVPDFFTQLARQQSPRYLWIGCSDSRVSANEIVDLMPGEVFVHRNIANVVVHSDLNCLSVMQFAVDVLKVTDIIVCGHYGCGGVRAALDGREHGLIDNWLRHLKDIYRLHQGPIDALSDPEVRTDRLCELNVIEQVANVCHTTIVQGAWKAGQPLAVHGWIYGIQDGILRDLRVTASHPDDISITHKIE